MQTVLSGLDRWIEGGPAVCGLRRGARIALLAHPASVDRRARHVVAWLARASEYRLVRLFAPEHGLWGCEQDMEAVAHRRDPLTGLDVVSLYGHDRASLRPDPAALSGLAAIVVDLQDVGTRFYTYVYTMAFVMQAAGEAGVPVVVLDRPNPIGGERLEGPVLEPGLASFVGEYPLPVRHAMTIGELASMFHGEFGVECELRVVAMRGWRRSISFEQCALPWVPPSPNMPSVRTALVYPGGCLIEGTNLSEGRGTTLPFELVGAPWLDPHAVAAGLDSERLAGVLSRPATFRPMFHKHAGIACHGVQLIVTRAEAFEPFLTYLALIRVVRRLDRRFAWRSAPYEFESERPAIDHLLGVTGLRERLESDEPLERLRSGWEPALDRFAESRRRYLLYD